jgi:hypothetical protein
VCAWRVHRAADKPCRGISASGLPASSTRPLSTITIGAAMPTAEHRCATTIVVVSDVSLCWVTYPQHLQSPLRWVHRGRVRLVKEEQERDRRPGGADARPLLCQHYAVGIHSKGYGHVRRARERLSARIHAGRCACTDNPLILRGYPETTLGKTIYLLDS